MKPYIIYILGTGHSGSTILQYLLAGGPEVLGLGEIRMLATGRGWRDENKSCSCGLNVTACPVWGDLSPVDGQPKSAWYRRLVSGLSNQYPQATHWVDSSKTIEGLQVWLDLLREGVISDIRIVYLVRDVRSWVVSDEAARCRKDRRKRPLVSSMLEWWRCQIDLQKFLVTNHLEYRLVSYEAMVFQLNEQMRRLMDFAGISGGWDDLQRGLRCGEVHDVFGNRVKSDAERRSSLVYEDAWQYSTPVNLFTLMLWPVWRMNVNLREQANRDSDDAGNQAAV